MTWVFAKGRQRMSCEAREAMLWYELIVTEPDGVARASSATRARRDVAAAARVVVRVESQGWGELEKEPAAVSSLVRPLQTPPAIAHLSRSSHVILILRTSMFEPSIAE